MINRIFLIVYLIANLGLCLYGVMALLNPGVLMETFTQTVYTFPREASAAVNYMTALFRLLGYFNLLAGMVGLILLWRWQKTQEAWTLWSLSLLTTLGYMGPVVFDNTVGRIGVFEALEHIIFTAVIIIGVVMVWKERTRHAGE